MKDLRGRTVVVTGAVGDLGQALCLRLCRDEGAIVWACDIDESGLTALEEKLRPFNKQVRTQRVDVTDMEQLAKLASDVVARDKQLDVWINNAGIASGVCHFEDLNRDTFERVMEINFGGVVNGTRVALSVMQDCGKGVIVNIASIAGIIAAPYMSAYSASKHAVVGFTRSVQTELELNDSPVRSLLVLPGFFASRMVENQNGISFPDWMRVALSKPDYIARATLAALKKGRTELICTTHGKLMNAAHLLMPQTTRRGAQLMLARTWKDILLNRYRL